MAENRKPVYEATSGLAYFGNGTPLRVLAGGFCYYGPTPLVAACRSYVACKLGGEVEVPDFLE